MTDKTDVVERLRDVPNFNDGRVAHEAADELTRLRAEVARLEAEKADAVKDAVKDAERYRWLRERLGMGDFDPVEGYPPMMIPVGFRDPDPDPEYEQQIDAAIDTAMRGDREDG